MRPVLRYHGGKYLLADWLISLFPPHRVYVEPFGGAASVLLRKPRSYAEVYNDLEDGVVNLFRVLREPSAALDLESAIRLTPFARKEFEGSYEATTDPIERARRTVIRAFMGFGSGAVNEGRKTGFRSNSNRSGTTPARDWVTWPDSVKEFTDRLQGVVIENRDAIEVMQAHDSPETLHYVDPPYVHEVRQSVGAYKFEMGAADHEQLADYLHSVEGMVILSGYRSEMYESLYSDWSTIEREALADGAKKRVEVVWMNPACESAQRQQRMFA